MEKCDVVVVYTTEAAPIYHEVEYTYGIGSVDGILILWNQTTFSNAFIITKNLHNHLTYVSVG